MKIIHLVGVVALAITLGLFGIFIDQWLFWGITLPYIVGGSWLVTRSK